jgi:hypothetical protein
MGLKFFSFAAAYAVADVISTSDSTSGHIFGVRVSTFLSIIVLFFAVVELKCFLSFHGIHLRISSQI